MKEFGVVPIIACSALDNNHAGIQKFAFTGRNSELIMFYRILQVVTATHDAWSRRISTWVLNRQV
jgi:hypothetical protein